MFFKSKVSFGLLFIGLFVFSCTQEEKPMVSLSDQQQAQKNLIPQSEINKLILKSIKEKGDFLWMEQTEEIIWSALMHSDSILTIGYKPASMQQPNSRIGIESPMSPDWQNSALKIISMIEETIEKNGSPNLRVGERFADLHEVLPLLEVKITDIEVLRNLRNMAEVRYFEPIGYQFDYSLLEGFDPQGRVASDEGCSNEAQPNLPTSDYTVIDPGAKSSWNYSQMGISQAWPISTGAGVTVGLIDTGISPNQPMLNSLFNSGFSSERMIYRFGTYKTGTTKRKTYDGPDDKCGHGTSMAGVIASPRNTVGNALGVAYNSNLVSVRGTADVVVNTTDEKNGVTEALLLLGKRSDVKIISMSIGDVYSNSKIADAIRYAYNNGKLIFAAAGTSTSLTSWFGVIFPATMAETVAVTGVKEGTSYQRCATCHSGSKVEFTVIMERAGTNTKPLSVAMSGNDPSTVGGSSVATATAAGIAALVWSKNPTWTRTQVLEKMRSTSALYPNKSSQFGYGNLNAFAAVN